MPKWLPERQADLLIWIQNFALKLNVYVGTAGIVAGDVTAVNGWRDIVGWTLGRSEQVDTAKQDLNEWKQILLYGEFGTPIGSYPPAPVYPTPPLAVPAAGVVKLIIQLADRIRNTVGYTTAIGEDLGIESATSGGTLGDPEATVTAEANSEVRIVWVKSFSDGVIIEGQRAGEVVWTLLATDRYSPFVDARAPLEAGEPEVRRYRLRYLEGDDPVGNYSPIYTVTTIP